MDSADPAAGTPACPEACSGGRVYIRRVAQMITERMLLDQEAGFAKAFSRADLEIARPLYHPAVVYLSPTVQLFGWPARIEGIEKTLEFIGLTIAALDAIEYRLVEHALIGDGAGAFVRIHFDWNRDGRRWRSNYVVIYRYRDGRIGQQELYYDPSGRLEMLA